MSPAFERLVLDWIPVCGGGALALAVALRSIDARFGSRCPRWVAAGWWCVLARLAP